MNQPPITVPEDIASLLRANAPVAIGVSGGKDSVACSLAVARHLDEIGHVGPRILVHADLGLVEWADSYPSCERVATKIGWEIQTVRRAAGGMMERWEKRWENNVARYENLECVMLILPWSTPSMRFCTSELKSAPIASFLKKRYGKVPVISVTGIRADESPNRAKMPGSKSNPRLHPGGLDWNPILHWNKEQVFAEIATAGIPLHEAYTVFGSSRVSCAFCIMSKADDLKAALRDERNLALYRRMCRLELKSAFSFQGGKWLSEHGKPFIDDWALKVHAAKIVAREREEAEQRIPKSLHFTKGWPERMPTPDEAGLIAAVRRQITTLYGFQSQHLTQQAVLDRYAELIEEKSRKEK